MRLNSAAPARAAMLHVDERYDGIDEMRYGAGAMPAMITESDAEMLMPRRTRIVVSAR